MESSKHNLIIAGSEHEISVKRVIKNQCFLVELDGIPFEIFLSREKSGNSLAVVDGQPVTVGNPSGGPLNYTFLVNETEIQVSFSRTSSAEAARADRLPSESPRILSQRQQASARVVAHMPGRIVAVKANASDKVKIGDPMFVLLAMKMENTLVSPIAGVVKEVFVEAGASVNKGDLLALIE